MSTPAKRRLMRDFKRLQADPPQGVTGTPHEDDIMDWSAVIFGPDDSPWEGGSFQLSLHFSDEYPNKPPVVKFVTKLFHPNVYPNGAICLDILQNQWSPIYDIAAILTSIQSLLTDPNPLSPANVEAAKLYTENRREYERKVMKLVEESWFDVDLGEEEEGEDPESLDGREGEAEIAAGQLPSSPEAEEEEEPLTTDEDPAVPEEVPEEAAEASGGGAGEEVIAVFLDNPSRSEDRSKAEASGEAAGAVGEGGMQDEIISVES